MKTLVALLLAVLLIPPPLSAASGLFPKMPPATTVYVVDASTDGTDARMTAWALQGLVNQIRAEVYVTDRPEDEAQLQGIGKTIVRLPQANGANPALRVLFGRYSAVVKKMVVYDPNKDWTFYLALMAAAQGQGIPVTEQLRASLSTEFRWKGQVEDLRHQGASRVEGYDWALANLMPGCSKKVVFALSENKPLIDYVAASRGFVFWLDFKKDDELAEAKKIFASKGYTVGTTLMGYASDGDDANQIANPDGIGYVVSDFYANGSFWSSFPDKTYRQAGGMAIALQPGKIYVSLRWSDGDNISFDQLRTYRMWRGRGRTTVPIATTLAPSLQELNSPLLDWYYSRMTPKDELISGPSGVQFIFGDFYDPEMFPAWCSLSGQWLADAGFHADIFWHTRYPSDAYGTCLNSMKLAGVFQSSSNHFIGKAKVDLGTPVVDGEKPFPSEKALYDSLVNIVPKPDAPFIVSRDCGVQGFGDDGFAKIQAVVDRLNAAHPGLYVFLLPKDLFASIREYYKVGSAP